MLIISIITLSDRAFNGIYEDLSGPKIKEIILENKIDCKISNIIIPDEVEDLKKELQKSLDSDYIITTGGTGISPRDITPEVTRSFCDFELPGISEMLRYESLKETQHAVFSRGFSGVRGKTIIINFPGSVKAVTLCTKLIVPILEHGKKMIEGKGH